MNRDGFVVTEFDDDSRQTLTAFDRDTVLEAHPEMEAIVEFVRREFPGFVEKAIGPVGTGRRIPASAGMTAKDARRLELRHGPSHFRHHPHRRAAP